MVRRPRSAAATGRLTWFGGRPGVLRSMARAPALATDSDRSSSRLSPPAEHLAARDEPDPGLHHARVWTPLLRNGDPCQPRPWPARTRQPALPDATSAQHAAPRPRLHDA